MIFLTSPCWAVPFSTDYVSLEIPENWTCFLSNVTRVCHNKDRKKAAEYVIILTAKEIGQQDNLSEYSRYLKQKKIPNQRQKKSSKKSKPSEILHVNQRSIASHTWVDGFHKGSEYPEYFTRYLVSTKKNISVLVTYTVHTQKWKQYSSQVLKSILSLRILEVEETLRKIRASNPAQDNKRLANYLAGLFGDGEGIDLNDEDSSSGLLDALLKNKLASGGVATVGGGLLYYLFKRLKRRKRSSSHRRRRRRR